MDGFPKDRSFIDAIVGSSGRESPHSLDAGWIISLAIVTSIPKKQFAENRFKGYAIYKFLEHIEYMKSK
jgi:hypothetical protein